MGIDRIVIGIPSPKFKINNDSTDQALINELTKKYVYEKNHYIKQQHYIKHTILNMTKYKIENQKNNARCYSIYSDNAVKNKRLCAITIGRNHGNYFLNIAINPSNLSQDDLFELQGLFSILFNNHYEEIYQKGVVSHFEFFIDVSDIHIADLLLIDEGRRKTTLFKGTTYHGCRKSPLVCTMYDKAAQQKLGGALTRIEARINRRDIKFSDLVENGISNPFEKFFVVHKNSLQLIAQEWKQPQLVDLIQELGVYGATQGNPSARKKILERLHEHTVSWWQPQLFWEAHRKMLLEFKPAFLGGSLDEDQCPVML
ncbi:hypothetical protein C8R26_1621 [Nitrosomonas oligotropha]|uniref:Replication initiation factor n=1 Tax=Nitrosomonas oligotropha TaxID=42354 RepID=A0A2T5H0D3_9PROT|nr:hypothetical protein [Nitrosomonas oligotropha]PTQ65044.1 hypothetical protein C8R26_1621 [Nitrosomonas oligotropha]